jgi:TolB-like protein
MADPPGSTQELSPPPDPPASPEANRHAPASTDTWTRIKEHKILQWGLGYLGGAIAIAHGQELMADAFDWPHLVGRILMSVLILGFPLVLTLAWYHGHRGLKKIGAGELAILSVLVLIASALLVVLVRAPHEHLQTRATPSEQSNVAQSVQMAVTAPALALSPATSAIPEKSVAVLPFLDMSEKKDQEYFSDGLSEELIDMLTKIPNLRVPARTSSFYFKGKQATIADIAKALGVAHVLEGSVRKSGNVLRITAQLVRASNGYHLWSQTYDRKLEDIFKIQDEIAAAVVVALQTAMAMQPSLPEYKPANMDAYNAFSRGRYFLQKGTKQDSEQAIAAFEEALKLDPRYAAAWAGIAATYNRLATYGWMPPKNAYPEVRRAVDHALSIDPNLAAAHWEMSNLEWNFAFDAEKSREEARRAREMDPSLANREEAFNALAAGQLDAAIHSFLQAVQRDPLNAVLIGNLGFTLQSANRLAEAESVTRRMLELNPAGAHCALGEVLLAEHKPDAALATMREETDQDSRWCIADALWALGRRKEADAVLAEAKAKYADSQAYSLAASYALRNDKDEAFKWLDRAYDNRESGVMTMWADAFLRSLRGDPRFTALLRKLKLPQ